jgi:NAD(P)-dependent dehydrogenase (short-subunit alcohol dehydrogenase family)
MRFDHVGVSVADLDAAAGSHPLGRLGEPEDVARVALFLASDDAAYLNAVDIVVDGGQSVIS